MFYLLAACLAVMSTAPSTLPTHALSSAAPAPSKIDEGRGHGRADLTGHVQGDDGRPASGHVYVYTAGPKEGVGTVCSSCYLDCGKRAAIDGRGRFLLPQLDTTLVFRLLVVSPGHVSRFVERVDPSGKPQEIVVNPMPQVDSRFLIRGRIVDPWGNPVIGASVTPFGRQWPSRKQFGRVPVLDPIAVSDARGEFMIATTDTSGGYYLRVAARGFASRMITNVHSGAKPIEIRLAEGVTVTGRLLLDDRPFAGAVIGICQLDRNAESFLGADRVAADETGHFELVNVIPDDRHVLYAEMSSVMPHAFPCETLAAGHDGTRMDIGTLRAGEGSTLRGRILLSDGRPLPPHSRLMIGRDPAWDNLVIALDSTGTFLIQGVPAETCEVFPRIMEYRMSLDQSPLVKPFPNSVRVFPDGRPFVLRLDPIRH